MHQARLGYYKEIGMIDNREVAKIILLAGQSNADGAAQNGLVEERCGAERAARLFNGFEGVRMCAHSESDGVKHIHSTVINSDVPIKIGQCQTLSFGPEIGIAEHLSDALPKETFYVVKHAIGGSCLAYDWYVGENGAPHGMYLRAFLQKIDNALRYIDTVLDKKPEIVAFVWMQGESDGDKARAPKYFDLQMTLVKHIRERYAYYSAGSGMAFIDGGISAAARDGKTDYYWPEYNAINESKQRMAALSDMNYYVDTIGAGMTTYEDNHDYAHYGVRSQLILGHLFGECLVDVMKKYRPSHRSEEEKPIYPSQNELEGNNVFIGAAELERAVNDVVFPTSETSLSNGGDELALTFIKDRPIIRLIRYMRGARYLTLGYRAIRDMSITVYPNPSRESAVGGEEFSAKLSGGDGYMTACLDLTESAEFAKYGPFLSSLMIRFEDACNGETVTLTGMSISTEPQTVTETE